MIKLSLLGDFLHEICHKVLVWGVKFIHPLHNAVTVSPLPINLPLPVWGRCVFPLALRQGQDVVNAVFIVVTSVKRNSALPVYTSLLMKDIIGGVSWPSCFKAKIGWEQIWYTSWMRTLRLHVHMVAYQNWMIFKCQKKNIKS